MTSDSVSHDDNARSETGDRPRERRHVLIPLVIGGGAVAVALGVAALVWRSEAKTNHVPLSSVAKPVTVVAAKAAMFRPSKSYIGTIEPWVEAKVGPQFISAYVDTVLVRPGAEVKRGQVMATLDCRNASAASSAVAAQARAIDAQQKALTNEATRVGELLHGGFASPNESEQRTANSMAKQAELLATQAKLAGAGLEVSDCILKAPFDGEVGNRWIDPGAFIRPGTAVVSVVDRSTVRYTADVPESDFDAVVPGATLRLHAMAIGQDIDGVIARRSPSADPSTRTVHFEVDIPDPKRVIPVGTTGEARIEVGEPIASTEIPLASAAIRNGKATVYVVDGDVAHSRTFVIKGESGGSAYVDTALAPGTLMVTEGRALLNDGDKVSAHDSEIAKADGGKP